MLMFCLAQWWLTDGWKTFFQNSLFKLRGIADYFSFNSLITTLFSPFKQIDSGKSLNASIQQRFQDAIATLISRLVGAFTRITILIIGTACLILYSTYRLAVCLLWPFILFSPILGIFLVVLGA